MSDSETADVPSAATIARALRQTVIAIHKTGSTDDLTVKRVRTRAEQELGLPSGFLKSQDWKTKSSDLIREAVETYCTDEPAPEPEPAPPRKAPRPVPQKVTTKKSTAASESARGPKRKAAAPAKKLQKRRKIASSDDESEPSLSDAPDEISDLSGAESGLPKKPARRQKKVVTEDSDEEDVENSGIAATGKAAESEQKQVSPLKDKTVASDSDMSSLIDESPVKKKRRKKSPPPAKRGKEPKAKEPKAAKPKAKPKADDDPDQAEIKRLQGWLVKCGIRKVWGKELVNCDTSKEKIRHLKGMLQDAGMDGKYSVERAAKIKEKREFAKDLEEIQAGEAAWGKQEVTVTGRPRRGATKAAPKPVIFSDDDEDGDKSDNKKDDTTDDGDDDDEDDDNAGEDDSEGS